MTTEMKLKFILMLLTTVAVTFAAGFYFGIAYVAAQMVSK